jgi:hypothetical protein
MNNTNTILRRVLCSNLFYAGFLLLFWGISLLLVYLWLDASLMFSLDMALSYRVIVACLGLALCSAGHFYCHQQRLRWQQLLRKEQACVAPILQEPSPSVLACEEWQKPLSHQYQKNQIAFANSRRTTAHLTACLHRPKVFNAAKALPEDAG